MKRLVKFAGVGAGAAVLVTGGAYAAVTMTVSSKAAQVYETHGVDFPVPFPLSDEEIEELRQERLAARQEAAADEAPGDAAADAPAEPLAGVELDALALERAIERGEHLVESRYACVACHGDDFGGGTMIDDPAIGTFLGPNITTGEGSVTAGYEPADWDRIVRHGVKPDGTGAVMPSEDFEKMSDRELSDIVAYLRTQPPVDATVPAPTFGPLGKVLIATGEMRYYASTVEDHHAQHRVEPPETGVSVEFGAHMAGVCTGCHRASMQGGPMPFGPPDWPPAGNLTPHADGLAGWAYDDFVVALTEGKRPDGTALREPMNEITPFAKNMSETERKALFAYLQSLEPLPTGK